MCLTNVDFKGYVIGFVDHEHANTTMNLTLCEWIGLT